MLCLKSLYFEADILSFSEKKGGFSMRSHNLKSKDSPSSILSAAVKSTLYKARSAGSYCSKLLTTPQMFTWFVLSFASNSVPGHQLCDSRQHLTVKGSTKAPHNTAEKEKWFKHPTSSPL